MYTLDGESSCFFSNANETTDATISYKNVYYNVPAWSVTILPDCITEVYNTAKVTKKIKLFRFLISIFHRQFFKNNFVCIYVGEYSNFSYG